MISSIQTHGFNEFVVEILLLFFTMSSCNVRFVFSVRERDGDHDRAQAHGAGGEREGTQVGRSVIALQHARLQEAARPR